MTATRLSAGRRLHLEPIRPSLETARSLTSTTCPSGRFGCIRVRPGYRGKGISHDLQGAVEFAREGGAPAIEGYPVDNQGEKVDLTMAYIGTRRLFERAGFVKVADTASVLDGFPRVLMRRDLR